MQTVLVVKYDSSVAQLYKIVLEERGQYQVSIADNARDGLHLAKTLMPRVVIIDTYLPDKNGLALAQSMRGNDDLKNAAIIILTQQGESEDKLSDLYGNCDAQVSKPVSLEKLCALVDNLAGIAEV